MASIYLPPIARKKKVDGWPRQNTSRVFPDMEENAKQEGTSYTSQFIRHNVPPAPQRIASASRKNKPQPKAVTFLRQNPRFVCEPICHVDTTVQAEDNGNVLSWWPDETVQTPVKKPLYSLSSTSRADYKNFHSCSSQTGYSRHENLGSNAPRSKGAVGIVPGYRTSENSHPILEKISYEHQFNSRLDPSHPVRGKRHGCFVWKVVTPTRNKHGRDRSLSTNKNDIRDVSYELTNAEAIDDNMDAKSMVSTLSDKTTKVVKSNAKGSNELQLKNDAWCAPAPNTNTMDVDRLQEQTTQSAVYEMTDDEKKDLIKPSRPRRLSPPPHTI
ncbi:uncharacterized protein C2orf73-like [Actinia tenebrosa]|uniref:Uncharacterized protein C2orf73-like n=1 Tax=Actinia tenebrosa TaxID=6105 RepID=A0A6P8H7Z9_ACTTE|nr:uncharacterized protein C2orf73-like [Actinia tenebrosa]